MKNAANKLVMAIGFVFPSLYAVDAHITPPLSGREHWRENLRSNWWFCPNEDLTRCCSYTYGLRVRGEWRWL